MKKTISLTHVLAILLIVCGVLFSDVLTTANGKLIALAVVLAVSGAFDFVMYKVGLSHRTEEYSVNFEIVYASLSLVVWVVMAAGLLILPVFQQHTVAAILGGFCISASALGTVGTWIRINYMRKHA